LTYINQQLIILLLVFGILLGFWDFYRGRKMTALTRMAEGIYKRGDGQYQAKIQKKGYPKVSRTFDTLALATEWRTTTLSDLVRGEWMPRKQVEVVTLEKALTRYSEERSAMKKGERQEMVRIESLKKRSIAKKAISAIEPEDVEDYITERRSETSQRDKTKKVSDATIRLEVMLLSAVFKACKSKRWNYLRGANPVSEIDEEFRLKKSTKRTRRFIGDEESRLLAALDKQCRNRDIPLIVRFAITTAARQSEIIGKVATSKLPATPGLTWEKVDLKMRSVTFPDTKNKHDRVVPLGAAALALLSALPRPIHGGPVFAVTQDGLIRAMAKACEDAGIEDFTFHDLRHEATSRMIEDGHPVAIVQKITGHSSAEMTERYTHIDTLKTAMKLR